MAPHPPVSKVGLAVLVIVGGLAVSGGGGTVGFYTDTAISEGNSISAGSWTTELDVRFTPETLNAGNQGTTTVHLESSTGNAAVDPATVEAELEGTAIEVPIRTCKPTKCLFEPKAGALVAAVDGESGEYTLRVTGELEDGTTFEATTPVMVAESD